VLIAVYLLYIKLSIASDIRIIGLWKPVDVACCVLIIVADLKDVKGERWRNVVFLPEGRRYEAEIGTATLRIR